MPLSFSLENLTYKLGAKLSKSKERKKRLKFSSYKKKGHTGACVSLGGGCGYTCEGISFLFFNVYRI